MKKHFFYMAMALVAAFTTAACSSDDDEKDDDPAVVPVSLSTPSYADQAIHYDLTPALKASSALVFSDSAPELKAIDFSESGKILLEIYFPADEITKFVMDDATVAGNVYTMNGSKVKGTIKVGANARTRADDKLTVDITVKLSDEEEVNFDTKDETVSYTTPAANTATSNTQADNLCRTWNVLGAILDLKSKSKNVKAYEEFTSRGGLFYLDDVLQEALKQDVKLTAEEQEEFKRVVKNVTITKSGLFIINYVNHTEDVAKWEWANAEKTAIKIQLMDEEMGNKFISDDTKVDVAFNGNRCNMKLDTSLTDNDNNDWESQLTLKLQE